MQNCLREFKQKYLKRQICQREFSRLAGRSSIAELLEEAELPERISRIALRGRIARENLSIIVESTSRISHTK